LFMRDYGDTEVAGYGITDTEDPLLVTDFRLIKSRCTSCTFEFDPEDIADFLDEMLDDSLMPWQCSNILIHTHPGDSPNPSSIDEKNFKDAFSHPNWAIMFILAKGGKTSCRLKVNIGPGTITQLKTAIAWDSEFPGSSEEKWEEEYKLKVIPERMLVEGIDSDIISQCQNEFDYSDLTISYDDDGDVEFWNPITERWNLYDQEMDTYYEEQIGQDKFTKINKPIGKLLESAVHSWIRKNPITTEMIMENT